MTCGVYSIKNTVNEKEYIGSSHDVEVRWRQHRNDLNANRHHSRYLNRAWNVHGEGVFVFAIQVICSVEKLLELEQVMMDERGTADRMVGYNVCSVAGSRLGMKVSEESRLKMSNSKKGKTHTEETKAKMSAAHLIKPAFSDEHKANMSIAARTKAPASLETKAKMSEAAKNVVRSDESNARRSSALKGIPKSPETIAKRKITMAKKKADLLPQTT